MALVEYAIRERRTCLGRQLLIGFPVGVSGPFASSGTYRRQQQWQRRHLGLPEAQGVHAPGNG